MNDSFTTTEINQLRESTLALLDDQNSIEPVTERAMYEHIGTMEPSLAPPEVNYLRKQQIEHLFAKKFVDVFMHDESTIPSVESFNHLIHLAEMYDIVTEESKLGKAARGVARKGEELSKKAAHAVRNTGRESKRVKVIAERIPAQFDNLVKSTFGKIKTMDAEERRRRILEGSFRFKIYKIIRNGIIVGAGWAVAPALTAIGIVVAIIRDKKLDKRARIKLIQELRSELRIVEEKVRDAEQKGDNRKKYQLMRIRDRLTNDLNRIQYHLDGERHSSQGEGNIR